MKEDRYHTVRRFLQRSMLILLLLCIPVFAGCDRDRSADIEEYDLKDLRNRRENLGRVTASTSTEPGATTTARSLDIPDARPVITTTTPPPLVLQTTTAPPATDPPVTDPPAVETAATTEAETVPLEGPVITVRFDSDGGSPVPSQTIAVGSSASRPEDPVREGYEFIGWYIPGEVTPYDFSFSIYVNYNLVAGWRPVQDGGTTTQEQEAETAPEGNGISVHFNSNGGSAVASQNIATGGTAMRPEDPIREGYEFLGWYIEGDSTPYDFSLPIYVDYTLIAGWRELGENDPQETPIPTDALPEGAPINDRAAVKPQFKPEFQAATTTDQEVTGYVSRFLDYQGAQGTALLPPFDHISEISPQWIVNYYLDDFVAAGNTMVLLADIQARAAEEINPEIVLDPSLDYGNGYNPATAGFDLTAYTPRTGVKPVSRVTAVIDPGDGRLIAEVTELQFRTVSGRSNAGIITAQNRVIGYFDENAASGENPRGEFFFQNAEIIAQVRYILHPNGAGGYYLAAKTWNTGMSEGLYGIDEFTQADALVTAGGSELNIRAFPSVESARIGSIPDGTSIYVYTPSINGMYLAFSVDGGFHAGYVSADYVLVQ